MRSRWRAASLAALVLAGCGAAGGGGSSEGATTLTVFAASSLRGVFPRIADTFSRDHPGVAVRFSFGGTDILSAQIEQGAPADVFAGVGTRYGDRLATEGLIEAPKIFSTNRLVMVMPSSNPGGITSLRELATVDVKLVMGSDTVPVGIYTRAVLRNLDSAYGEGYSEAVLGRVVSNEPDTASVLAKVRTGEADAGFVYVTDARSARADVKTVPLPTTARAVASYPIAVVNGTEHPAAARRFVDQVLSSTGQRLLRRAGFGPPAL